jgi:2-oxoglutarate dehydrogenase E1 component
MAPKSGLRARQTRSTVDELELGHFHDVLDDATITDPASVRRIVLCTGKVAWDALAARDAAGLGGAIAVVRLEQLYPWPEAALQAALARYHDATEVRWLQEEPENMGGWYYVRGPLFQLCRGTGKRIDVIARDASASPASGSHDAHDRELADLKARIVDGL